MKIEELLKLYGAHPKVKALKKTLGDKKARNLILEGLSCSSMPMTFAALAATPNPSHLTPTVIFILPDEDVAGYVYHDLMQLLGTDNVLFFPSAYKRAAKYGQHDPANEILRTEVLGRLADIRNDGDTELRNTGNVYVVTFPAALAELVVSKKVVDERKIDVKVNQQIEITEIEKQLISMGFERQDYVYEPGQFAHRGSIIDVYSFSSELPIRIDFFGDEIDTIRTFEVEDQLSKERKDSAVIVPELAPLAEERQPLTSFLPDDAVIVLKDEQQIVDAVAQIYRDGFSSQALNERLANATEAEQRDIHKEMSRESVLLQPSVLRSEFRRLRQVQYNALLPFGGDDTERQRGTAIIKFDITPQPLFHKNLDLLSKTFSDYRSKGYRIYIMADSGKQVERINEILTSTPSSEEKKNNRLSTSKESEKGFDSPLVTIHEGFADNDLGICFFTDHQIFDRYHKYNLKSDKARSGKMALTLKELQEMEVGDYVVHVDFGVGKFLGLVRVPIPGNTEGACQEVIRLQYQKGDKVDVSIHSLYKISKYRSNNAGEEPRLSILGSGAWEKLKERTKKKIKDIARDLIRLYAKRRKEQGFSFSPDSYLQNKLEASFLYEDTPDQLRATQDVKHDMESIAPMDRLVCGDVGFGKTEVAIRAAFKAAVDGKQVAVLVPTTVLAFQHFRTFSERLQNLPVRVDYLSRARSAKTTRQILEDLKDGKIDILIGTHKLISKTVKWHDLGLLIVDEEQKFGVSTKEKLRQLKTNIDTLTMSATPIPRTLQFSLMGARDMSIIRTPPPNRYPIHTQLASFGHEVICDAINFEMSRNGQVFFVNPRISNLEEIKRLIERHIPDCRIAVGHGRMSPDELEKIIVGFMNYDYDVLLSTTIVENGIDISNANTIIINDAHKFGLSDLHQMRGRVGRSNKKAFCYLLSPPLSFLNNDSRTRLEAMETFSDLGSGFALAMQDLDIRGAGNLLGAEQSGFMEDLGYETYQKILKQAIAELRNEEPSYTQGGLQGTSSATKKTDVNAAASTISKAEDYVDDCSFDTDLEMYFPDSYIPGSAERILLYRELDNIETDRELQDYQKKLEDRFGPIPAVGRELMNVVPLRRLGKKLGCPKIILKMGIMQMHFITNPQSPYYRTKEFGKVINYSVTHPHKCKLKDMEKPRLVIGDVLNVEQALKILTDIINS